MKIELTPAAQQEVDSALGYYEELRFGLAKKIAAELDSTFEQIQRFPETYQCVKLDLRRVELQTIPYQIYYAVVQEEVPILGFVPARLHPSRKHRLLSVRLSVWKSNSLVDASISP